MVQFFTQRNNKSIALDPNNIVCAIRRTFLKINKDLSERNEVSNK